VQIRREKGDEATMFKVHYDQPVSLRRINVQGTLLKVIAKVHHQRVDRVRPQENP